MADVTSVQTPPATGVSPASDQAAITGQNPQDEKPVQQRQEFGISKDDQDLLVKTIETYRQQWAPDRLLRIPQWMKNTLMYRGSQVLAWDTNTGTYFDALSFWKQNREDDGQEVDLEKFICNITQMLGLGFKGIMSRGVPASVVKPRNAEILADVTTAQAAQEALEIIDDMNDKRQRIRDGAETLYLYGSYFTYTRGVLDGEWAGYDEQEKFGPKIVARPDRYHCFNCGTDTPAAAAATMKVRACPKCKLRLGDESFYEGSVAQEIGVVGTEEVPRAMVKQSIHSPMEIDLDPQAKTIPGTPILSYDQEIDVGEARMLFPAIADEITEGMEIGTTPNASYERLRRNEVYSLGWGYTSDSTNQRPTYSQNWMNPASFYRLGDKAFAARMKAKFPKGLKLTLIGPKVCDIRPAIMAKEWTACRLHERFGLYSPAVADNVVPFNERFNNVMQMIDEGIERNSFGLNVINGAQIDKREISGKPFGPGELLEIPVKFHGQDAPLNQAFAHFDLPMEAKMFEYPNLLLQFCTLIACLPPQVTGSGTLPGVETAKGQKQMLDVASNALNIYWENIKKSEAASADNAIYCLQNLMKAGAVNEIWSVIEDSGSQFRNNYVNFAKMRGKARVDVDTDQGLPSSPEEIRAVFQNIFEEAGKGNPIALKLADNPTNQQQMLNSLGAPGLVQPDAAQQAKTEQDINTLLEKPWIVVPNPQTGQPMQQLPVMPDKNVDDFVILKAVIRLFRQENSDVAQSNPQGWARLNAFYEMAKNLETADAVDDANRKMQVGVAGQPKPPAPPPPDPTVEAARADLITRARRSVDRLAEIGELPPQGQNGALAPQVTAESTILKTALEAVKAGQP